MAVSLLLGPGSDLSEEPAFQDVEPVTLDEEPFLIVLPGPPFRLLRCSCGRRLAGVGRQLPSGSLAVPMPAR